jgi:hypothetical protein
MSVICVALVGTYWLRLRLRVSKQIARIRGLVHWEPSHPEERLIPLRLRLRFHNGSGLTLKIRREVVFVPIRVVFLDLETWETNRGISICDNVYVCTVEAGCRTKSTAASLVCSTPCEAGDIKQCDSVLPPCPMNSRHSVIPPRNNRKHEADPSLQFSSNRPISECKSIEKAGLAGMVITDKSARISLHVATAPAMSGC